MESLTSTELAVLDQVASGPKDLEGLFQNLSRSPLDQHLSEVADAVKALVEKGLLMSVDAAMAARLHDRGKEDRQFQANVDASYVWKARFMPTPLGEEIRSTGINREAAPGSRLRRGCWKDPEVEDITSEEIAEARREMWGSFPRDIPR
jgi:hypothetical protein